MDLHLEISRVTTKNPIDHTRPLCYTPGEMIIELAAQRCKSHPHDGALMREIRNMTIQDVLIAAHGFLDGELTNTKNNRMSLKSVNDEIQMLLDTGRDVDLSEYREYWLDDNGFWDGWVNALSVRLHRQEEMKLAVLLDKKATIRFAAGKIKRALYNLGIKTLKK